MSVDTSPQNSQLLPIKIATTLIPYSRDYVTRLARDGRVTGIQVNRQWFVEKDSLLSFYEQSQIEETIRSRRLSQVRKVELEAHAEHQTRLKQLMALGSVHRIQTILQTVLILLCGVSTGIFIFGVGGAIQPYPDTVTALIVDSVVGGPSLSPDQLMSPASLADAGVTETTKQLPLAGGIILLPEFATNTSQVADFFSDTVTIEMTGTTSGMIRSGQSALPFVRIPETSKMETIVPPHDTQ